MDAHVPGKREADERIAAENVSSAISGAVAGNDKKGGGMGKFVIRSIVSNLEFILSLEDCSGALCSPHMLQCTPWNLEENY